MRRYSEPSRKQWPQIWKSTEPVRTMLLDRRIDRGLEEYWESMTSWRKQDDGEADNITPRNHNRRRLMKVVQNNVYPFPYQRIELEPCPDTALSLHPDPCNIPPYEVRREAVTLMAKKVRWNLARTSHSGLLLSRVPRKSALQIPSTFNVETSADVVILQANKNFLAKVICHVCATHVHTRNNPSSG